MHIDYIILLVLGDSELRDYVDGLASNLEQFAQPHNIDTKETILHLLSKEGKLEILQSILQDERMQQNIAEGLLVPDELKWTPIMAATIAVKDAENIVEMFIDHLDERLEKSEDLERLMSDSNLNNDTLFTLLMRNGIEGKIFEDFSSVRRRLFELLEKHSKKPLHFWFLEFVKQLLQSNSCDLTSRSMKELIDLCSRIDVDFSKVMKEQDEENGNNILMELAKNMKDDALREILTNAITTNNVSKSHLGFFSNSCVYLTCK